MECLPSELHLDICERLDYQSAIRISQVNRYFHATIDPQKWPLAAKKKLIKRAMKWKKHHTYHTFSTGYNNVRRTSQCGLACFTCFRVKPISSFATKQVRITHQRCVEKKKKAVESRCCIDCSIEKAVFRHGQAVILIIQTSELYNDEGCVLNVRIMDSERKIFCAECQELHSQYTWASLECQKARLNEQARKRASRLDAAEQRRIGRWVRRVSPESPLLHKKNFVERGETGRHCGLCDECEPASFLGEFWCPTCVIWACWSCCLPSGNGPWAYCGPGGSKHMLRGGSYSLEVHEKLAQAQKLRPAPPTKRVDEDEEPLLLGLPFDELEHAWYASDKQTNDDAHAFGQPLGGDIDGDVSAASKWLALL